MLIGFFIWFLIFLSQILYFSQFPNYNYCWSSSCKRRFPLPKSSRRQHTHIDLYERSLLKKIHRKPLLQRYEAQRVNFLHLIQPFTLPNKYLIYTCNQPCGGWGDRTRKIVGAYLLSLVLNRTFLINMTWPCPITHLLEPNFIQWNRTIRNYSKLKERTITNLSARDNDYREVISWTDVDVITFKVKDLSYYSLLIWRDDFYRILHLQYGLHRSTLFIHTIFTLVYELLFKLTAHPQSHLDEIYQKLQSKELLCAHIRIGRNPSNPNDAVFPKRERMNTTVIGFLKNISKPNQLIFISTDSEEVRTYARKQFQSRLLNVDGIIRHIDRSGRKLACDGLEKTLLDFYMISYCQSLVMSKSAFRLVCFQFSFIVFLIILGLYSFWANTRRLKPYENLYLYCDGIKRINGPHDYDRYPYGQC